MMTRLACQLSRVECCPSTPPILDRIVRPVPRGSLVARFTLPLSLCVTQNSKRHSSGWSDSKRRHAVAMAMFAQVRPKPAPLPGRPQVLCLRLSTVEPDAYSDWAKQAVDVLCAPTKRSRERLNIIVDDAPKFIELHQWWEPAKRDDCRVMIEVWTGEP